jgi:uncharacterized protein YndB with AHSA1/START domain
MLDTKKNLEIHCRIPAKPEKVFEAWTHQEAMSWYCPENMTVIAAEADVKVRGKYRVSMRADTGKVYTFDGIYEEIVPNRKLVFTHQWEASDPVETHVTVEFAEANGGTEITIKHDGIATEEQAKGHEAGWTSTLRNLANQFSKPAPTDERPMTLSEHGLERPLDRDIAGPKTAVKSPTGRQGAAVHRGSKPNTSASREASPPRRADDHRTVARGAGLPKATPVRGVQQRPDHVRKP